MVTRFNKPTAAPTRLYLVRHGSTSWNEAGRYQGWANPPLSPRGRREARQAAHQLAHVPLRAVYSSDLQRAWETARHIVALREEPLPPLRASPDLREIGMGLWEGLTYEQIEDGWAPLMRAWYEDPHTITPPGGEAFAVFRARVAGLMRQVVISHQGDAVALVTHGGVIRVIIAIVKAVPFHRTWGESVSPGGIRALTIDNVALARLHVEPT